MPRVWQPGNARWWILAVVASFIVVAWPADRDKSLALKLVNWAVDPRNELPILPGPIPIDQGDNADAVDAYEWHARTYDELYRRGGWMRMRLESKVADDPFDPGTERQLLVLIGVVTAFLVWRFAAPEVIEAPDCPSSRAPLSRPFVSPLVAAPPLVDLLAAPPLVVLLAGRDRDLLHFPGRAGALVDHGFRLAVELVD